MYLFSVCSFRVAPPPPPARDPGSSRLPDHQAFPAQKEEAERLPHQPEDPEGEPESGERDRHRRPEEHQRLLLPLLEIQNGGRTSEQ